MKIDLALLCDYALIDQYGKLSVMGIFEHLWISQFPIVHPRIHLVIRLKGRRTEIGSHAVRIRLVDDEGTEVLSGNGRVDFSEPPAGVVETEAGTVLVFDVPFSRPGQYHFEITLDDTMQQLVPLTVAVAPNSPSPEAYGSPP